MILLQGMLAAPFIFPLLVAVAYLPQLRFHFVRRWLNVYFRRRVWPVVPARWPTRTSLLAGALLCAFLVYLLSTVKLLN
ncbi:hypothetical protein LJ737_15965 [Hymenobacter sp. 15J16-1T3B]|uniref:hypothetical protein n=1 Tax=Hymenobacter sp. 15J16-1T3B TaxID=2886941 RepID=UPI001D0FC75E|nr:hypothetical protein [Hymenobacter sp. 15J16-1T3B]MCC3158741.1 hypothetical protein [Hymenobacter sp. 15J16-1T3B]